MRTPLEQESNKMKNMESSSPHRFSPNQRDVINKIESDNVDLKKCFNILNTCETKENIPHIQGTQNNVCTNEAPVDTSSYMEQKISAEKEELTKRFLNIPQNMNGTTVAADNSSNEIYRNMNNSESTNKNELGNKKNENYILGNKLNFNNNLELRKSLTEQLCEEISMKLGRIFLCKSFLETYIYEENPYLMNFIYARDDLGGAKNKVMNSLLVSSFADLVWNENIYKHEYLLSKELLKKYAKTVELNPDNSNYAIVPVFSLDRIKEVLDQQEMNIKLLKKKKLVVKKNNENLLFILNIIKNNFCEIKNKGLRIVQRLLLRLNLLDKLFMLKNSSNFVSSKYEHSKMKLITILDFFNSFSLDSKLQKINKNIMEIAQARTKLEMDVFCSSNFSSSLKNVLETDEQNLMQLKMAATEISTNLEENKEFLYHLNDVDTFE